MTQQSLSGGPAGDEENGGAEPAGGGQVFASAQASDDILDDIDSVLESNAETFVRSFVQKGGQ